MAAPLEMPREDDEELESRRRVRPFPVRPLPLLVLRLVSLPWKRTSSEDGYLRDLR